jgi:DNA-binding IclR family transcriptional regulator
MRFLVTKAEPAVRRRRPKWVTPLGQKQSEHIDERYYSSTIGRALDVLDSFTASNALSLKEISQQVCLPESSTFRILQTLQRRSYLVQNVDGTYQLAKKLFLGWLASRADKMREMVHPHLEELAGRFDETASVAYLFDDRIHVLDCVETFHEIRVSNRPGRVLPPHCSAMGKAITAFQDRSLVDRLLEVYGLSQRTDKTIVERQALLSEFQRIRESGLSFDHEESVIGGICISAAIQPKSGPVIAAISISTPVARMTSQREREIVAALVHSAGVLSAIRTE